jgi:hypothetical protein
MGSYSDSHLVRVQLSAPIFLSVPTRRLSRDDRTLQSARKAHNSVFWWASLEQPDLRGS